VIRFDNRDNGLSTHFADHPLPGRLVNTVALFSKRLARKHAPYLLADEADDAVALMDHLGIDRAHVVGASMGGMIAQTIAIEHPHRVASLCSIMSNTGSRRGGRVHPSLLRHSSQFFSNDPERAIENGIQVSRLISGPHFDAAETRAIIEEALSRDFDPAALARQTLAINASPDRTEGLHGVSVPSLVIHGMLDKLVTPSGGRKTAKAIPGSTLVMFPDMAHDLPRVRWNEVFDLIADNARRAEPSARRIEARA
jgi:pimeloyl-ACP methyl ester carboxylesterase